VDPLGKPGSPNPMKIHIFCNRDETIAFRLGIIWSIARHGAMFGGRLPVPSKRFTGVSDTVETFTSIPYLLATKQGDCVGAATYLCAWYLQQGRFCRPVILRKKDKSLHCAIWLGGRILEATWIYRNMPGTEAFELRVPNQSTIQRQLGYMR
jgi:hypothetical protein